MLDIKEITRKNIRYYRKAQGMSQLDLAAETQLDASHIGKIERGEMNITVPTLQKIADALGVTIWMLTWDDDWAIRELFPTFISYIDDFNLLSLEDKKELLEIFSQLISAKLNQVPFPDLRLTGYPLMEFELTSQMTPQEEGPPVKTYGIKAMEFDKKKYREVEHINNITTNKIQLLRLVYKLNSRHTHVKHFYDIVLDFCCNDYRI